ncbi:MAG: hypothetical protein H7Y20_02405 [Bryobacteraceae bacterium]|nr:hypothetical protein [Bryobacteraceae bacterium]
MVPARPAWNSWRTPVEFLLTGFFLGSLAAQQPVLAWSSAIAQAALLAARLLSMKRSQEFEEQASARLLSDDFRRIFWLRLALLLIAPALPFPAGLVLGFVAEVAGRYLFFVTVVPRNMAATFFGTAREAA